MCNSRHQIQEEEYWNRNCWQYPSNVAQKNKQEKSLVQFHFTNRQLWKHNRGTTLPRENQKGHTTVDRPRRLWLVFISSTALWCFHEKNNHGLKFFLISPTNRFKMPRESFGKHRIYKTMAYWNQKVLIRNADNIRENWCDTRDIGGWITKLYVTSSMTRVLRQDEGTNNSVWESNTRD